MANLVLNGEPIDTIGEIDKIEANYVEADMLDAFRNGLLEEWLREQLKDDMADAIGKLKEGKNLADNIIKVLGLDKDECMASQRRIESEKNAAAEKAKRNEKQKAEKRTQGQIKNVCIDAAMHESVERHSDAAVDRTLLDRIVSACDWNGSNIKKFLKVQIKRYGNIFGIYSSDDDVLEILRYGFLHQKDYDPVFPEFVKMISKYHFEEYSAQCKELITIHDRLRENIDGNPEEETIESLEERASIGDVVAQHELGDRYYEGKGCGKNRRLAVKWYKKSAESGYMDAMIKLSMCYALGQGIEQSWDEAEKWSKAASGESSDGMERLKSL